MQREIPVNELTKTLRDATEICREIGARFLWIDSLCIIQASHLDWTDESALMADVYRASQININAVSAADGSVGCFFNRNPRTVSLSRIVLDPRGREMPYHCVPGKLYEDCVTETPLASRARRLQERFLARKGVCFSWRRLFWECNVSRMRDLSRQCQLRSRFPCQTVEGLVFFDGKLFI